MFPEQERKKRNRERGERKIMLAVSCEVRVSSGILTGGLKAAPNPIHTMRFPGFAPPACILGWLGITGQHITFFHFGV